MLTRQWFVDAGERVARAFLVTFIGQMLASSTGLYSVGAAKAAAAAGIASALSVVLSLLGAANSGGTSPASIVGRGSKKAVTSGSVGMHTVVFNIDTAQAEAALRALEVTAKRTAKAVTAAAPAKASRRRKATGDKGFTDVWLLVALLVIAALVLGAGVSWWFLLLLLLVVLVLVRG